MLSKRSGLATATRLVNLALIGCILTLSIFLLMLSWPRWLASFRYIPVDKALDHYFDSGEIPSARLGVLIGYAQDAIGIHDHYRFHQGLSTLYLMRAQDQLTPALERRGSYESATSEAALSLGSAPAQSSVWLRLAYLGWVLHEEIEDVIAAWKMSIFTGRTDQSQYRQRLEIGIAHRDYLDQEATAMLRDQMLLAWRAQPSSLVAVLTLYDPQLAFTRTLIENTDPQALQDMEKWLEKLR